MNDQTILQETEREPFKPLRLHLASGKTVDVMRPDAVMPLGDSLLWFHNMPADHRAAERYSIITYQRIERIEQLDIGSLPKQKRRNR